MWILTEQNAVFNMDMIPDEIHHDLRYCVLDYSNPDNVDYYFMPLIFLENFYYPVVDITIGKYRIQMPLDWSIVIGGSDEIEIIPLKKLNDREFLSFCFNPIKGFMPSFLPIDIVDIFPDTKWYFPKLKFGHILCCPLENKENPQCAYFVRDINKLPETLDIRKLF